MQKKKKNKKKEEEKEKQERSELNRPVRTGENTSTRLTCPPPGQAIEVY